MVDRALLIPVGLHEFTWKPVPAEPIKSKSYADRQQAANEDLKRRIEACKWHSLKLRSAESRQRFAELSEAYRAEQQAKRPKVIATIAGLMIRYDIVGSPSDGSLELIRPGAMVNQLAGRHDIGLMIGHNGRSITSSREGGLILTNCLEGVRGRIEVPETSRGRELLRLVRGPNFAGWSFTIDWSKSAYSESVAAGREYRTIDRLAITEISAVRSPDQPAFPLRELPEVSYPPAA